MLLKRGFRVQCYSIVDGKPVNLDGLAEQIREERKALPRLIEEEEG